MIKNNYLKKLPLIPLLLLSACQSMPERNAENTSSIKYINIPQTSIKSHAQANDLIYTNINQISAIVMKPTESMTINANLPLMSHQVSVTPKTMFFKGKASSGETMICSIGPSLKPTIGNPLPYCLIESEPGMFNKVLIGRGMPHAPVYAPKVPSFIEDEIAFNPTGPTKREVYFNKVDAGNIFLTYKEYSGNTLTKTQPLNFLIQKTPFTVAINDIEFEISNINDGIEYTVVKVVQNTINDDTQVNCVNKNSGNSQITKLKVCSVIYGIAFP